MCVGAGMGVGDMLWSVFEFLVWISTIYSDRMIFTMNVKIKNKKVVTETGVEPATSRFIVTRLNQLNHRGN